MTELLIMTLFTQWRSGRGKRDGGKHGGVMYLTTFGGGKIRLEGTDCVGLQWGGVIKMGASCMSQL